MLTEGDTSSVAGRSGHGNGALPGDRGYALPATREGQPYVSRLATRAAFYVELQALLAAVHDVASRAEYRRRVLEDNVLSRRTVSAREKTWKELGARYGIDGASPLFRVFLDEYRRSSSEKHRGAPPRTCSSRSMIGSSVSSASNGCTSTFGRRPPSSGRLTCSRSSARASEATRKSRAGRRRHATTSRATIFRRSSSSASPEGHSAR